MGIPWNVALAAWIPFPIASLIAVVFVILYFSYYKANCLECSSALVSVTLFVISIIFLILIPVDVYLVSSTKNSNGTPFDWADNNTIIEMERDVLYGYYGIFGMMLLIIFIIFPFSYFANHPDSETQTLSLEWLRGLKAMIAGFFIISIMLVIGGVVPMGKMPDKNSTLCSQLKYVTDVTYMQDIIENALVFAINCCGLVGMLCAIIYTAYGMVILPVNMMKGQPPEERQLEDFDSTIAELKHNIQELLDQANAQPLSEGDRQKLTRYSQHLSNLESESDSFRHRTYSCFSNITCLTRPVEVIFGIIVLLLAWFFIITIAISNTNRVISNHGMHTGYLLWNQTVLNPLNSLLMIAHQVFPLDYLVLGIVIGYFTCSSISGVQHMGMWLFWIKIHRLRANKTSGRALLFCTLILALVTLYSAVLAYSLAPQYVTYGTQMYRLPPDNTTLNMEKISPVPCSADAPAELCIMTRLMALQTRLFYRMWFFGVAYFWCSWIFILVFVVAFVVAVVRNRKTIAQMVTSDHQETAEDQLRLL